MSTEKIRVRFAPSPTGGLHLGGVRTVLFNYLFARQHKGDFVLRIEDTDQKRYVEGAEQYILDCLAWCGLAPDESVGNPGSFGPYRQSERKELYQQYAQQLVEAGHAYYAFDTAGELEKMREMLKDKGAASLMYDHNIRMEMNNSLSLPASNTQQLLDEKTPYVIRLKVEPGEEFQIQDLIRGEIKFESSKVDDKVLLKADGMPTYHLAVVVDDYSMEISHAFRGEEWLPSAPVHILLWKYLFGLDKMPHWAHLPLILKPDGHGKLSKRDGDRLGFPVYAMDWQDPISGDVTKGFRELGFLPEAFINMLALLGWNDGTEKEIYTIDELINAFSLDRVHIAGAKFDFEKAKWFNHEWIKMKSPQDLLQQVKSVLKEEGLVVEDDDQLLKIIALVKDRCTLVPDFIIQSKFFFQAPATWNTAAILPKWTNEKEDFFKEFIQQLNIAQPSSGAAIEEKFKSLSAEKQIKAGELLLPLRIMLVGDKYGPGVFDIADIIGRDEFMQRIENLLPVLKS